MTDSVAEPAKSQIIGPVHLGRVAARVAAPARRRAGAAGKRTMKSSETGDRDDVGEEGRPREGAEPAPAR